MNCDELIHIKYHVYHIFIILVLIAIFISIYMLRVDVYDVYNTIGSIKSHCLVLNVPIEHSDTIQNGEYLIINDEKYEYEIKNISAILLSNNVSYQEVVLAFENDIPENSIVDTKIYYDKEKVATKLKELIYGG